MRHRVNALGLLATPSASCHASMGSKGSALRGGVGCPCGQRLRQSGRKVGARVRGRSPKGSVARPTLAGPSASCAAPRVRRAAPFAGARGCPPQTTSGAAGWESRCPTFVAGPRRAAWLGQGSPGLTLWVGGWDRRRVPRSPATRSVPPYRGIIRRTKSGLPGPSVAWRLCL